MDMSKYNNSSDWLYELEDEDDVAKKILGSNWCIPNVKDYEELMNYTKQKFVVRYNNVQGLNGIEFTSDKNNNKIFFPAGGFYEGDVLNNIGSKCYYWTSELCFFNENGCAFILDEQNNIISNENPWFGYNIRPVIELKSNYENNE